MPRQKASEIRVEEDYNIRVVINRFGDEPKPLHPVIELEGGSVSAHEK